MNIFIDQNIAKACKTLFGCEAPVSREFLQSIDYHHLKSAFRKKAFETHPDLHIDYDAAYRKKQSDLFIGVHSAYNAILAYCEKRDKHPRKKTSYEPAANPTETSGSNFSGIIPRWHMEIGRYLYYRGCIPYGALIKALSMQKSTRPHVGSIAKQWKWLNDAQIGAIISLRGRPRLFGERTVYLEFLTPFQVRTLLAFQRTQQRKLGQYFIESGLLTENIIAQMIMELKQHNAMLSMSAEKNIH